MEYRNLKSKIVQSCSLTSNIIKTGNLKSVINKSINFATKLYETFFYVVDNNGYYVIDDMNRFAVIK